MESLEKFEGDEHDQGLSSLREIDLSDGRDVEVLQIGLEIRVLAEIEEGLGDLVFELCGLTGGLYDL